MQRIYLPHYIKYPLAVRLCKMMYAIHEGEDFYLDTDEHGKLYIEADERHRDEICKLAFRLNGPYVMEQKANHKTENRYYEPRKYKNR